MELLFNELTASEANSVVGGYEYGVAYVPGADTNFLTNAYASAIALGKTSDPFGYVTTFAVSNTNNTDNGSQSSAVSQTTTVYAEYPTRPY
ncbi:MAG: hypothetical protein DSM106950_40505 [Stigonema ocellatum SAG 48.90 = DSM 106950]|nr:hypothetical protein [Stigonema ocellatum SAG 48.90 = DSM 106950]